MKYLCLTVLNITLVLVVFGQKLHPNCSCPKTIYAETHPDTVFYLTNGKSIALCGNRDIETVKGKTLYSEFVLSPCGSDKIIKFWGALKLCQITVVKDTLIVQELINLPVGKNMSYLETIWTVEHIYYDRGIPVTDLCINPQFPKYNESQKNKVLILYKHSPDVNNDNTIEIADKLFISTISGSQQARNYLINFRNKFKTLDGVYLEGYDDLIRMLKLWDSKNRKK